MYLFTHTDENFFLLSSVLRNLAFQKKSFFKIEYYLFSDSIQTRYADLSMKLSGWNHSEFPTKKRRIQEEKSQIKGFLQTIN